MSDLISREKLKRKFCGHCEDYGKCKEECFDVRIINSMSTAEKKGRWVYDEERGATGIYAICTACNEMIYQTGEFNYCPSCGAKMEE